MPLPATVKLATNLLGKHNNGKSASRTGKPPPVPGSRIQLTNPGARVTGSPTGTRLFQGPTNGRLAAKRVWSPPPSGWSIVLPVLWE